ncbi:MAG: tetratricopeptide repeat protein [bacterium]
MKLRHFKTSLVVSCTFALCFSLFSCANAVTFSSKAYVNSEAEETPNNNDTIDTPQNFKYEGNLKLRERVIPQELSDNSKVMKAINQAQVKLKANKYKESLNFYIEALSLLENNYKDSKYTLESLEKAGWISYKLKDYSSAICYFDRLFSYQQKYNTNYDLYHSYNTLTYIYKNQHKINAYEDVLNQSLSYCQKQYGANSSRTANVNYKLGELKFIKNDYTSANNYLSECFSVGGSAKLLQPKTLAMAYDYISTANFRLRNYKKAEQYSRDALEIKENYNFPKSQKMTTVENIIMSCVFQKKLNDVSYSLDEAIDYRIKHKTDKTIEGARLYLFKAALLAQSDDSIEAKDFLEYSLVRYRSYIKTFNMKYGTKVENMPVNDLKEAIIAYDDMISICSALDLQREAAIYSRQLMQFIELIPSNVDIQFNEVLT